MSSQQEKQNIQQEMQVLVKALQDSSRFSSKLKEENERLTSEINQLKVNRELNQKQIENQQKTILFLTEQNKQIQYRIIEQDKMYKMQIQELNKNYINITQLYQAQKSKQSNNRLLNDNINIHDEINNENSINPTKNLEINRSITDKQGLGFIGNGYKKFPEVHKQDNIVSNSNANNIHSIYNNNFSHPKSENKLENIYSLSANSSKNNINENQDVSKYNFTFSRSNQNGINPNLMSQQNNQSYNLNSPFTLDNQQTNLPLNNNFVFQATEGNNITAKNIEQLKLNESSVSTSNSRIDYSPNNRYIGGDIAENIKKKYEQNLLKVSHSTNILSSIQLSSPISKQSTSINNQDISGQLDSSRQRKQIFQDKQNQQILRQKSNEEELNLTYNDQNSGEKKSSSENDDDTDENTSQNQRRVSPVCQTPRGYETKSNNSRSEINSKNNVNEFGTKVKSDLSNDDSNYLNEPEFDPSKQMTFGNNNSPQINYYRQQLQSNQSNYNNPKQQLIDELNLNSANEKQSINSLSNIQQDSQQRMYQNNLTVSRKLSQQESNGQLETSTNSRSKGKPRKIFETNNSYSNLYSNNGQQQANQTQSQINYSPNKNEVYLKKQNHSQISFNNQYQFDNQSPHRPFITAENQSNHNEIQNHSGEKHSAYFDVGSIVFNDNKSEQQYQQVIYSPERNDSNINNQINSSKVILSNSHLRQKQKRNTKENQFIVSSDSQSQLMKELYPSQLQGNESQRFESSEKLYLNSGLLDSKNCNLIDSQGQGSNIRQELVQKVQIKSPKSMMDISKKNQFNNSYIEYMNEVFTSQNNLIENFFILSADQKQLKDKVKDQCDEIQVDAETIYCYPDLSEDMKANERSIHQLAFPNGVYVKQKLKTTSQSDLLQIVLHDYNKEFSSDGFVFTLKTEQSYEKSDQSSKNSKGTQRDVFDVVNPNKLLYCICISQKAFIDFKDPKLVKTNSKKMKKEYFYEVDSVYCIVTKFPDIQFFLDVLENVLNMMKVFKSEKFDLQNALDFDLFYFKKLQQQIESKLSHLVHQKIPQFDSGRFSIPRDDYEQKQVTLVMKSVEDSQYIECSWGLGECMRRFSGQEEFVKLYISLLLEQSVVFVSSSRTLLSQFTQILQLSLKLLFHTIIKPLKWPHPMIITLPKVLNELLYSPTPMIIGLNESKKYLDSINFTERYPDFNVVYLDEFILHFMNDPTKDDNQSSYFVQILNIELQTYFQNLQKTSLTPRDKNSYQHYYDEKQNWDLLGQIIIKQTKELFCQHIVNHLPKHAIFKKEKSNNQYKNLDYAQIHQEINKAKGDTDNFLEKFFRTQIFTFYLEEYYGII